MNAHQRKYFSLMVFIVIIISAVVGFIAGTIGMLLSPSIGDRVNITKEKVIEHVPAVQREVVIAEDNVITDVVEKATPSVVSIAVTKDVPRMRGSFGDPYSFFFGDPYGQVPQEFDRQKVGGGSGFFISEDGLIVTNRHVVSDTDAEYTVITADGTEYEATVLARDTVTDFAVMKVESDATFPALDMGDSTMLKVGQTAIAIGNSLGEFPNTVSRGIVSGIGRDIVAGSYYGGGEQFNNIIQTDAAINPGNSGGPLLDINGTVIGINTAVAQGAQNIGFAIPIDHVSAIIDQVRETGTIERPFLGVRYVEITPEIASELEDFDYEHGVLLLRGQRLTDFAVVPGSSADKAGLLENDVILAVDGVDVDKEHKLQDMLVNREIGDTVKLSVWRKGEVIDLSVTLSAKELTDNDAQTSSDGSRE